MYVFLALVFTAALVVSGEAITCKLEACTRDTGCVSAGEESCDYCWYYKSDIAGVETTTRACTITKPEFLGCKDITVATIQGTHCYCDTDNCNTSNDFSVKPRDVNSNGSNTLPTVLPYIVAAGVVFVGKMLI